MIKTSRILEQFEKVEQHDDRISLAEINASLHSNGFGVLMIFFALPMSVPLIPPGITTILALPLLFLSFQLFIGIESPWLPNWIGKRSLKRTTLAYIIDKTNPFLRKLESFSRPRLKFLSYSIGQKIIALVIFIDAVSIAIPLPMTNLIPSLGVTIMSMGILNNDGIAILVGFFVSAVGISITLLILIVGPVIALTIIKSLLFLI